MTQPRAQRPSDGNSSPRSLPPPAAAGRLMAELRRYVGLGLREQQELKRLGRLLAPHFEDVAGRFLAAIQRSPHVRRILRRYSLHSLRPVFLTWLRELFTGPYDGAYARKRLRIGIRHVHVGVDQAYTAAAFGIVRGLLQERLATLLPERERIPAAAALDRILDLDLVLVARAYGLEWGALRAAEGEAERHELERKLSAIMASGKVLVLSLDPRGRILAFNRACEDLTGRSLGEVIRRRFAEVLLPPEDRHRAAELMARHLNGEGTRGAEPLPLMTAAGQRRWIAWYPTPLRDRAGALQELILLGHDVTEQREMQGQILHQEKMAALGLMAAGVAHEIGNPLASISSVTQTLQRKVTDPYVRGKLELVDKHIRRITAIVRQMADFARPPRYEWSLCAVNQLVQAALSVLRCDRRAQDVLVETDLAAELPRTYAIEDQLVQVFFNIAANALDAMEATAARRRPRLRVTTRAARRDFETVLQVRFADNGPGLPPHDAARIFEPFFTTKEVGRGTGLGLAVSYRIVTDHGGRIRVDPGPGRGAVFTVELPVRGAPGGGKR